MSKFAMSRRVVPAEVSVVEAISRCRDEIW
jgi:hypothetical protein